MDNEFQPGTHHISTRHHLRHRPRRDMSRSYSDCGCVRSSTPNATDTSHNCLIRQLVHLRRSPCSGTALRYKSWWCVHHRCTCPQPRVNNPWLQCLYLALHPQHIASVSGCPDTPRPVHKSHMPETCHSHSKPQTLEIDQKRIRYTTLAQRRCTDHLRMTQGGRCAMDNEFRPGTDRISTPHHLPHCLLRGMSPSYSDCG